MIQKLAPDLYLILVNGQKTANAFKKLFWIKIFWKYQRSSKNLTSFLFSNPISFYGNYCEKKRDWNESPIPFQVLNCPFFNDPLQDVRFCFFYIAHQCTEKNPNVRWRSPVLNLNYAKTLLSPLENGIFSVKIVILFIHANQKNKEHLSNIVIVFP